ncbi:L-histidine N(alpha)-methyltransferase [Thioalkalivibrio sp.]|uniref:L-histidine N(alpha)-methyltransferase n=1 Tax=Thioalkalivibrio sp. TaxID=2093813 RepID=UPI0039767552
MTSEIIRFHDLHPTEADFRREVLTGLRERPRRIAPKFFYDERGSKLFDAITEAPEYYVTRTESEILQQRADEIARTVGTGGLLLEPGGGSCAKVRILLEGLEPCAYVPMDISRNHLRMAAEEVAADFPWLEVHAAHTDFTRRMEVPPTAPEGPRVAFFPGSSIGNFDPEHAVEFIAAVADLVGPGGHFLIGVDLRKEKALLEAAYDDAQGVTAAFNLNLLERINRELGGDFDLQHWRHRAVYNENEGRVEMHLVSARNQRVRIEDEVFDFATGETIHTENSYKYGLDEFEGLARRAGMETVGVWTDQRGLFSVHLLRNTALTQE